MSKVKYEFKLEGTHITDNLKFSKVVLNEIISMNKKLKDYICSIEIVNPKMFYLIVKS